MRGTQTVLTAAAATGVRRVVLVHVGDGLRRAARQPGAAGRGRPAAAVPDGGLLSRLARDRAAWPRGRRAATPDCRSPWCARRPSSARASTACSPGTSRRRGCSSCATRTPRWQFCHVDDLVSALELAALGHGRPVRSPWAARAGSSRPRSSCCPGMRRIELPAAIAFGTAERLHRLGVIPGAGERPAVRRAPLGGAVDPAARGRVAADVRQPDGARSCCSSRSAATTPWPPGGSAVATRPSARPVPRSPWSGTAALVRAARRKRR